MNRFRRSTTGGQQATRGQIETMYAGMRGFRAPPPPPPPICPRCTGPLDPGTGHCDRCRTWPLLGNKDSR